MKKCDVRRMILPSDYAVSIAQAFRFSIEVKLLDKREMLRVWQVLDGLCDDLFEEAEELEKEGAPGQAAVNLAHAVRIADLAIEIGKVKEKFE